MSNILGTVINLENFLKDEQTNVTVKKENGPVPILSLEKGRKYIIPDFQREIRWEKEQVIELMRDIDSGQKFLGNIILTKLWNNNFEVIDGQQRISVLVMLLHFLKVKYKDSFDVFKTCKLVNESFKGFNIFMEYDFDMERIEDVANQEAIIESDYFRQRQRYHEIWKEIENSNILSNKSKARSFFRNLQRCEVNVIINVDGVTGDSIEYFIDVNLKGIKLDSEDIFKGYLFSNDSSDEIREKWRDIKKLIFRLNGRKEIYSIVKLFAHYFYCDLYLNPEYENLVFSKEEFLLLEECEIDNTQHYIGEHIIKVLNSNSYMKKALGDLICYLEIVIDIVESSGPSDRFKKLYEGEKSLDSIEYTIIQNLMKKILLDKDAVPKALIMKYVLDVLMKNGAKKQDSKKIYGIFMYTTLFMVFDSKKDGDKIYNIVKQDDWYGSLIVGIYSYFDSHIIQENKIVAQYTYTLKEDDLDERIRCKSLAVIYNFFEIDDGFVKIKKGKYDELKEFIMDDTEFSIEHFIINKGKKVEIGYAKKYEYLTETYKYRGSLFNFIFIDKKMNKKLSDNHVEYKVELLNREGYIFKCEYSKMIFEKVKDTFGEYPVFSSCKDFDEGKECLDNYYQTEFKQSYSTFVGEVISSLIERLSSTCT